MSSPLNVLSYFLYAGWVVKSVMFLLLGTSIASWTCILERAFYFRQKHQENARFLKRFSGSHHLNRLYADLDTSGEARTGLAAVFYEGFKAWMRQAPGSQRDFGVLQRAMQIVCAKETVMLERFLPFLASVGSIAPYVGLFGTVWGIMTSFQALGQAQQATIAMVAPGISEALVATALGLFTAIPAVVAYNRYSTSANQILERYELFQQEWLALLEAQTAAEEAAPVSRSVMNVWEEA